MKLRVALLASIISSNLYAANPVSHPLGASTTLGATSSVWSLSSANNNPAVSYLLVAPGDSTRFGLLTSIGFGYEIGAIDELQDKVDELDEKIDTIEDNLTEALTLQDDFNDLLDSLGNNASFKGYLGGTVPILPFIYKHDSLGAFTISADVTTMGSGRVLNDKATLIRNPITGEFQLNTATSIYVKNYLDIKFSLGYSNEFYRSDYGSLVVGARANIHEMTLGKSVLSLASMSDDEVDEAIEGEVEDNQQTTSATTFDIGAIWTASNYQLGVTVNNLNETDFAYKEIGTNCIDGSDNEVEQTNCFAAAKFAGLGMIAKDEVHTLAQQMTLEASVFDQSKTWTLGMSYDTNSVNDALGDEYQWLNVSGQLHGDWWIISGIRGGYRANMAGTELSYANVGATFFKGLNFDIAYGLESADDIPRSLYLSLGLETSF